MEAAHRGHQADRAPGAARGGERGAQLGDGAHVSCRRRRGAAPARASRPPARRRAREVRARSRRRRPAGAPPSPRRRGHRAGERVARARARPSSRRCGARAGRGARALGAQAGCAGQRAPPPPPASRGSSRPSTRRRGRRRARRRDLEGRHAQPRAQMRARSASASGVEPATAPPQPARSAPASPRRSGAGAGRRPAHRPGRGASAVRGVAPLVWPTKRRGAGHGRGGGRDLGVGHAQQDRVASGGHLAAAGRALDGYAGVAKRRGERASGASAADHAHAGARECVGLELASRSGPLRGRGSRPTSKDSPECIRSSPRRCGLLQDYAVNPAS